MTPGQCIKLRQVIDDIVRLKVQRYQRKLVRAHREVGYWITPRWYSVLHDPYKRPDMRKWLYSSKPAQLNGMMVVHVLSAYEIKYKALGYSSTYIRIYLKERDEEVTFHFPDVSLVQEPVWNPDDLGGYWQFLKPPKEQLSYVKQLYNELKYVISLYNVGESDD